MNKKLKSVNIKNKVIKNVKDGYYIEIEYMYGDADGYVKRDLGPFKDTQSELLYDAIETCERLVKAYPHGRGGNDTYDDIDGFLRWFSDDEFEENRLKYQNKNKHDNEHSELLSSDKNFPETDGIEYQPDGYGSQATFDSYKVFYYKDNEKYECNLKW